MYIEYQNKKTTQKYQNSIILVKNIKVYDLFSTVSACLDVCVKSRKLIPSTSYFDVQYRSVTLKKKKTLFITSKYVLLILKPFNLP